MLEQRTVIGGESARVLCKPIQTPRPQSSSLQSNNSHLQLTMASREQEPLVNKNEALQEYYSTLESRIGYKLVLGGTRHFGFYTPGSYWPFPINRALRAMEDNLIATLGLERGSKVLDAGCGVGHVAIHLAEKGYRVQVIDVVDHHIFKGAAECQSQGIGGSNHGDQGRLSPSGRYPGREP